MIAVAGSFSGEADLSEISAWYSLTDLAGPDGDPLGDARTLSRDVGELIAADLG
ncbi:MAG: hypothetical protein H0T54_08075 [Geodermatophilaceae bacterium]|nr:hypothetical protein [Geodermatophilaceae bacterium]